MLASESRILFILSTSLILKLLVVHVGFFYVNASMLLKLLKNVVFWVISRLIFLWKRIIGLHLLKANSLMILVNIDVWWGVLFILLSPSQNCVV